MTSVFNLRDLLMKQAKTNSRYEANLHVVKAHTISIDVTDSCEVSGRPGYKWVREQGMSGGVYQVPGMRAPIHPEMPVLIAYNPKQPWERMILDVDWSALASMPDYNGETFLPVHDTDHEWPDYAPGYQVVDVYPSQLTWLRTYPGSSGLTISVSPYRYVYERDFVEFEGESDLDLSSYQPGSGYAVRLLVYLDIASNALQIASGSQILDVSTLTPQPPTFPLDAYWSALVRLDGDQTTIDETDILRINHANAGGDSNIAASAVGQILISNDGLTMELGVPMVDVDGSILVDVDGHIVVS